MGRCSQNFAQMACRPSGCLSAHARHAHLPASWLLHDTQSFWLRTLALTHDNYVAEANLGEFLFNQGRSDEAANHFRAALAIRPQGMIANLNLGAYEDRRGNLPAAIDHYQMVINHAGDVGMRATAYGSLGFVYRQMGQSMKAKQCFETALTLAPERTRAMIGLGLVAQDSGDLAAAVRWYSRAVATQPGDVASLLLAQALQREAFSLTRRQFTSASRARRRISPERRKKRSRYSPANEER